MIERERPEIVLCGATALGRALMPRVAALVRTGVTADCTDLEIDAQSGLLLQTRPAFGGNIMATILCPDHRPQIATVRPKVLPGLCPGPEREVNVVRFETDAEMLRSAVEVIETHVEETGAQSIAEADAIVAGGRGMGSAGGFELIGRLARALGGAIGASRAAVDAGWVPYSHQVGQTGKTVQPKLYVACGISGAVQHLVGMQSARGIIAINRDPRAPIFDVADVGLVGDMRVVVPRLVEAVERRRKEAGR
jgi:electron transfer flavoprotein alpha subunit